MGLDDAYAALVAAIGSDPAFSDVEVVTSKVVRQGRSREITLLLDCEGGIDLATCEHVAARINRGLDAYGDPYTLAVMSAGLDRPLVRPEDFDRFAGRAVKIMTTELLAGAKTHRGILRGLRGAGVILETEGGELAIPLDAIASANVDFDVRADLSRAKRERRDARKNR